MTDSAWAVVGGSATGNTHIAGGIVCQDSHGWCGTSTGVSCFAVADGAGSRPRSAEGSAAAVRAVISLVRDAVEKSEDLPTVTDLVAAARGALEQLAIDATSSINDYATTLAVAVVGKGSVHIGQVGDSIVVVRTSEGQLVAVSPPEKFEYVNETVFISNPEWEEHLREDEFPEDDVTNIALSTDGLRFKILDDLSSWVPFGPFFEDVFNYVGSPEASSLGVAKFIDGLDDQSGDDKTLVVAAKAQSPEPPVAFVCNDFQITGAGPASREPTDPPSEPVIVSDETEPAP